MSRREDDTWDITEGVMQRYREVAAKMGRKDLDVPGDLRYREERIQVVDWLTADLEVSTPQSVFVEGRLPTSGGRQV